MVLLHSEKTKSGAPAPDFKLKSVDGKIYSLDSFKDKRVLIVMFICNHCPYVQAVENRIIQLARYFENKSVQFAGICSNDPTDYPDDRPEKLKERWLKKDYRFPYLIDESQDAARAYGAVCTPEFYVFDEKRKLIYRGQLDDNWKEPDKVTREDLKQAVEALLSGKAPLQDQKPSMGCSIKWKKAG